MTERTIDLILDTASRIFADHCDKSLLDLCEGGDDAPAALWDLLKKNGFNLLGSEESGLHCLTCMSSSSSVGVTQCHYRFLKHFL